jgi:hypothetical protein
MAPKYRFVLVVTSALELAGIVLALGYKYVQRAAAPMGCGIAGTIPSWRISPNASELM